MCISGRPNLTALLRSLYERRPHSFPNAIALWYEVSTMAKCSVDLVRPERHLNVSLHTFLGIQLS